MMTQVVDQSRTNMTFLKRAFGSQLDLATDAAPGWRKPDLPETADGHRSVTVQTDVTLIYDDAHLSPFKRFSIHPAGIPVQNLNLKILRTESPARWQQRRRWASITERRVADEEDAADIIISLGRSTSAGNGIEDDPDDFQLTDSEAYEKLHQLGITVSKCGSADIL